MSTENDEIDDFFREIENVGDSSKNTNNITTQTNPNSNSNSNGTVSTTSTNTTGIKRKLEDTITTTTTTSSNNNSNNNNNNTTSTNAGVKPMIPPSLMKKKQMISKTSINSNAPSKAVVSSKAVTYSANTINLLANDKPKAPINYPTTNLSIAALRPQVTMEEPKKNTNIVMGAAGEKWTDHTLAEWDPNDFRLFIGDLGNDVTEEMVRQAFSQYPTFLKAKVVFDKVGKSRGFGFVSFSSSSDYISALNTMNGKYIGNRPIKLRKSKWKDRLISNK
ncbi:hypothetical protein ACTFIU_005312 [Dictyostelium citrinum]